ncbi:MAG: [FeFe] hydrogenase, group A, partial [Eubacteriales bacterium]|nr:[FeFe] hydrogenase, group A [Eubacteriales bacterium]
MLNDKMIEVDSTLVPIENERNLLGVIRKAGIELPTLCYNTDLSIYGACRMCMVEDENGRLMAACSTPPKPGMKIHTNTARLRHYRRNILELLLASHCSDCTTCPNGANCRLQLLAKRFHIKTPRFEDTREKMYLDDSSPCIIRDPEKCILCGDCVRVCKEIQNIGAIDFANRGSRARISTAFDMPLVKTNCVGCGQCAQVCPTGAIVQQDNCLDTWEMIDDPEAFVTCEIAPAVRVAIGHSFGLPEGENAMGRIVSALHRIGFDEVYDTTTGADLTTIEEANEFLERLEKGENLPLFSSCCPAWVKCAENKYPELLPNVSSCKSPMQMFSAVIKAHYRNHLPEGKTKHYHIAIMPCTAKKMEGKRPEFTKNGEPYVDGVLTTRELSKMIRESGIVFEECLPEAVDMPFGTYSGAGVIFGVTGGVTEAVLRKVVQDGSRASLASIAYSGVRGLEGVKETYIQLGDRELHIGVVSGLKNASDLIEQIKSGEKKFDLVEVMACPGGCI